MNSRTRTPGLSHPWAPGAEVHGRGVVGPLAVGWGSLLPPEAGQAAFAQHRGQTVALVLEQDQSSFPTNLQTWAGKPTGTIKHWEPEIKVCLTVISHWPLSKFHLLCMELPGLVPSVFSQRLTPGPQATMPWCLPRITAAEQRRGPGFGAARTQNRQGPQCGGQTGLGAEAAGRAADSPWVWEVPPRLCSSFPGREAASAVTCYWWAPGLKGKRKAALRS